ncbi:DUF4231 domain-containing protein [Actinosynnema sp. NPDC050436]|uniref:DUF4231 domain-containing protein n=1 Tax=Actinosynnema sp. NPDC050436 TaxID=3155659 RepID=UPI00340338C5
MNASAVKYAWSRHRVWSLGAKALKQRVVTMRRWSLAALLVGAVAGAVAASTHDTHQAWSIAAAAVAAVAVAIGTYNRAQLDGGAAAEWTGARLVSEALKSEVFTFLAGAAPYREGGERALLDVVERIEAGAGGDLAARVSGIDPDGDPVPAVTDARTYRDLRVVGQISGFYGKRAKALKITLDRFRRVDLVIGYGGAALTAVAGVVVGGALTVWIGVLTTVGAALAAHVTQGQFEFQLVEYGRTANALELLCARYESGTDRDDDEFVAACERVISDQNAAWLAKLTGKVEGAS